MLRTLRVSRPRPIWYKFELPRPVWSCSARNHPSLLSFFPLLYYYQVYVLDPFSLLALNLLSLQRRHPTLSFLSLDMSCHTSVEQPDMWICCNGHEMLDIHEQCSFCEHYRCLADGENHGVTNLGMQLEPLSACYTSDEKEDIWVCCNGHDVLTAYERCPQCGQDRYHRDDQEHRGANADPSDCEPSEQQPDMWICCACRTGVLNVNDQCLCGHYRCPTDAADHLILLGIPVNEFH
jgi:hypothetical protein